MGRSAEITESGELIFGSLIEVGLDGVMQTDYFWQSERRSTPAGSVAAERLLEEGVAELAANFK